MTAAEDGTDAALAARGDVAAFRRLYHRHAPRMHSLARRLVGASEADDVVQDVFIRAWSRLDTFRAESAFATWLHRLATNVCLRRLEQSRRAAFDEPARLDGLPAPAADPGMQIDLTKALDRLPPALRSVVVLFDLEGYTHQEVAGLLGITTDSSRMRLSRARAVLRTILNDRSDR